MPQDKIRKCFILIAILQFQTVWSAREFQGQLDTATEQWKGKWFPQPPGAAVAVNTMGVVGDCDDGVRNLSVDYDEKNSTQALQYICLDDKKKFASNYEVAPSLTIYSVPPLYKAQHHCLNETIAYPDRLPTFGPHRQLWPVYGEYSYLPVQRWLHTLEHGGVAVLFHPCANQQQADKLKSIVSSCMYRYVSTPYMKLTREHPFALVTWGVSLEMSAIDKGLVVDFLKEHALKGPEKVSRNGQYKQSLLSEAKFVSDQDDSVLCPS